MLRLSALRPQKLRDHHQEHARLPLTGRRCLEQAAIPVTRQPHKAGEAEAALGETGYPAIQLMILCETGTRALIGAAFGSPAHGEIAWARRLLHLLDASMLVLTDSGFDGADFLVEVAAAKAQFPVRLTTVLDHRSYPATALIRLCHERREHEISYLALRHTMLKGRVLRSGDPEGIKQEMRALYQALRIAVTDAVQTVPGTDPRPG